MAPGGGRDLAPPNDSPAEAWLSPRAEEAKGIGQGEDPRLYPPVPVTAGPTAGDTWEVSTHVFPNLKGRAPLTAPTRGDTPQELEVGWVWVFPQGRAWGRRRNSRSAATCPVRRPQVFDMEVTGDGQVPHSGKRK